MKYQRPAVISLIIAILLLVAIFYSGALTQPYSGETDSYSVAHESSEAFNKTIEENDAAPSSRVSVDELSEGERRAFENAKEQPPRESEYDPDGWRSLGVLPVCDDALIVCDEYEEMANPSNNYRDDKQYHDDTYTLVEGSSEGDYLVKVGPEEKNGAVWHVESAVEFVTKLLILGPYALFLAYQGWRSSRQPTRVSMGYGAGLTIIVFAYPYFLMFTDISLPSWHLPALAGITWAVILVEGVRGWWKSA